ncbi:hypothetical protein IJT93_13435 [bacterium]|nr:hypothetical protein [bacterium]
MLELKAPVSCEVSLSDETGILNPEQIKTVLKKLEADINELEISGWESWFKAYGAEAWQELLETLEALKKCFHIHCFNSGLLDGDGFTRALTALRRNSNLGTLVFHFGRVSSPEDNPAAYAELKMAAEAGFDACAAVTLDGQSAEVLDSLCEGALDGGASFVFFERPAPQRDAAGGDAFYEGVSHIREMRDLGMNVGFYNCFPNCISGGDAFGCFAGTVKCFINAEARLSPCRYSQKHTQGDLLHEDLQALWHDGMFEPYRADSDGLCGGCAHIGKCPRGCMLYALELGLDGDPLISLPEDEEQTLQEVVLEDELCPVPRYNIRSEAFGWLLMRGAQVIPVTAKAGSVLAMLSGRHSLGDIEEKFGQGALSFVYSLYVRGFVEFREKIPDA